MQTQGIPSVEQWPEEVTAHRGVVVAGGYGVRISVWRGRLRVADGVGANRRDRLFHRATSGLKRLVVLGHTGYVSLEALRWLADIKAGYVQVDADGRVLAAYGPPGSDWPALRRAQARASLDDRALTLSRWLVDGKLAAQAATLRRFGGLEHAAEVIAIIAAYRQAITDARTIDELRSSEAFAAGAYWQVFAPLEVRFARRDIEKVPSHWRTFGGRGSLLGNGPRLATNPANAVLNYLYSLLEAEATLAARIVGLDPGLGVMHADQAHRDSLSADLMEPIRPQVDACAFQLLSTRGFAARDFFETRTGVCRVTPPLTHELAATLPRWRQLVGRVAEDFAAALEDTDARPLATPISGRRRANGRAGGARRARPAMARISAGCSWCGSPTAVGRKTCSDGCAERVLEQVQVNFARVGSERMTRLARTADHPALSSQAQERRRATRREQRAAELEWEREHPGPIDRDRFAVEVLPELTGKSARAIARATGLSVGYCADIKRGERVPHPRWWRVMAELGQHPEVRS